MAINPALIGKSGEVLVAGELMRRGVEVAYPASDVGVDLLAYRLAPRDTVPTKLVPIQVKSHSKTGYNFMRSWFTRCPGLTLVHVWHAEYRHGERESPEFYVFSALEQVERALAGHLESESWARRGTWSETVPGAAAIERMREHLDRWERITCQLAPPGSERFAGTADDTQPLTLISSNINPSGS